MPRVEWKQTNNLKIWKDTRLPCTCGAAFASSICVRQNSRTFQDLANHDLRPQFMTSVKNRLGTSWDVDELWLKVHSLPKVRLQQLVIPSLLKRKLLRRMLLTGWPRSKDPGRFNWPKQPNRNERRPTTIPYPENVLPKIEKSLLAFEEAYRSGRRMKYHCGLFVHRDFWLLMQNTETTG